MKIPARIFPAIILAAFTLFVLIGLALGFRPRHGGNGRGANYPQVAQVQLVQELSSWQE